MTNNALTLPSAVSRELVTEAREALAAELAERGNSDLGARRVDRQAEIVAGETYRKAQISHKTKVLGWRTKFLFAVSLCACIFGACRIENGATGDGGEDGSFFIALGIATFLFALITHWWSRM